MPVTAQEGITFWPLIIQWVGGGGVLRVQVIETERLRLLLYHITHLLLFVYSFLLFLYLSCSPSENVLFSQLLVIEGGHKQTQIKAKAALVQRLCVCCTYNRNKHWGKKLLLWMCFIILCSVFVLSSSSLFVLSFSLCLACTLRHPTH